jgi:hypothetical protein
VTDEPTPRVDAGRGPGAVGNRRGAHVPQSQFLRLAIATERATATMEAGLELQRQLLQATRDSTAQQRRTERLLEQVLTALRERPA